MSEYILPTYTGKLVDYLNPIIEMICIEDIAKALSLECRFNGQIRFHYSVGHHSLLACGLAPKHLKLEALLHDAEEAYIKDVTSPHAAAIGRGKVSQYEFIKKKFKAVIRDKFNLVWTEKGYNIIKEIDRRLLVTEADALGKSDYIKNKENVEPYNHLHNHIMVPEAMINIEKRFLDMFNLYRRDNGTEKINITNLREDRN
jgi:5'-deoxynucleotidase YfbR-like HD superfamily hydrolase